MTNSQINPQSSSLGEASNSPKKINSDDRMNIAIVGHVDHGKSTIIGRLLADTSSLPEGKLERIKENCRRNSKPFEYSFLLDALKDEQAQGITIDAARVFFKTEKRKYIIIDTPGHIEFLKNVVTGASRAEAALLVIDANEGIQENSKRYCYLLSMLGIRQIAVLINKMDLVNYSQDTYNKIKAEYSEFLHELKIIPTAFIPVSGKKGDFIATRTDPLSWYDGYTVLDQLDLFDGQKLPADQTFRMSIQDVYKFTRMDDDRRIIAGTITTGTIRVGDEVFFYPSGKHSVVKTIEGFNVTPRTTVHAGEAVGFTITDHLYLKRGELMVKASETRPQVTTRLSANVFWLGREPLHPGKTYHLKLGCQKIPMELEKVTSVIDASTLQYTKKPQVERHEVAECIFALKSALTFDLAHDNIFTSRFVIVDAYEIAGGGIITENLADAHQKTREQIMLRNFKWEKSLVGVQQRAERYNQKPCMLLITGEKDSGKKEVAKTLEKRLFNDGKLSYYLGIGSVLYGIDADLKSEDSVNNHEEHMRRMAEVANILVDSGLILIVTATKLTQADLDLIKTNSLMPDRIVPIWLGSQISTDIEVDYQFSLESDQATVVERLKTVLQDLGYIFKA